MFAHLVRGEVPQAGQGSPHQLSEGRVRTLPARVDCGQEGEDYKENKTGDLHGEVRLLSVVMSLWWLI